MLNRRTFAAGLPMLMAAPRLARADSPVTLWGPPAAPSILIAQAVAAGTIAAALPTTAFKVWKTPDEMRAGISSGTMGAVVVPTYVAANLYNRGLGVRLVNVLTDGLLYVVAPAGTIVGVGDLKGRRVAVPFRNDMPDYIFRRLLGAAQIDASEVAIEYTASPPEAMQLLMAGRVDAALLSEPAASAAIARAGMAGRTLMRAIDCQKAWLAVAGRSAIPQAGLAVTDRLAGAIGERGLIALHRGIEAALRAVRKDPAAAAAASAAALDLPAPMIERSIPFSNLVARTATAAREDLAALFEVLAQEDPRIIGGRQPDLRFYAV